MQVLVAEAQELVANGELESAAERFREALSRADATRSRSSTSYG